MQTVPLICRNHLFRPIHYRVLWWMLAKGATRGNLMRGWMQLCAVELEVHRITLNRTVKRLIAAGFVVELRKGTHGLVSSAFRFEPDERVKVQAA